ncbi:hypothetical protein [Rhizobium sp. L51/94]|uniref:hypothetical protein n=1 Tax=Rhizobium sp. L51/94 TaxID=2819999 RepID=UPI001C5B58EF|nr:hypothetical protein [Rhizobium sp. L51/94]QXZ80900.1 hypothetical protein J5274_18390 [Rhizobium sp. L51/94]
MKPVFVVSSFRSSSTWLWGKFRQSEQTLTYYEPFHEGLSHLTQEQAMAIGPGDWKSGHPESAPYFLEMIPLLKAEGGVTAFNTSFAFQEFIASNGIDGELSKEQLLYVETLLSLAKSRDKTPVLACTRSLGRVAGLKKAFGGVYIFLYRPMYDHWMSYLSQARAGNTYFIETTNEILRSNKHDDVIRWIGDRYPISGVGEETPDLLTNNFYRHFALHIYLYIVAFEICDIKINVADVSRARDLGVVAEDAIADKTGIRVSIHDAERKVESHDFLYSPEELIEIEQYILDLIKSSVPQRDFARDFREDFNRDVSMVKALSGTKLERQLIDNEMQVISAELARTSEVLRDKIVEIRLKHHALAIESNRNASLRNDIEAIRKQVLSITESRSWRITRPIRFFSRLWRSCFNSCFGKS